MGSKQMNNTIYLARVYFKSQTKRRMPDIVIGYRAKCEIGNVNLPPALRQLSFVQLNRLLSRFSNFCLNGDAISKIWILAALLKMYVCGHYGL